jgi:invasion protein IalB
MTSRITNAFKTAAIGLVAATFMCLAAGFAQAQAPGEGWYKICTKQEDNDVCAVQNAITTNTGQLVTAIALITVEGKINRKSMQVTVPPARLIPPGITLQIDGGKEQRIPYAICMPDKCIAEVPLTDALVDALKRGGEAVFTSINYVRQPNPIEVSLKGFTATFDGPPVEQSQLQQRQKELQEAMQKKALEDRKKLEDAQKKALEGN